MTHAGVSYLFLGQGDVQLPAMLVNGEGVLVHAGRPHFRDSPLPAEAYFGGQVPTDALLFCVKADAPGNISFRLDNQEITTTHAKREVEKRMNGLLSWGDVLALLQASAVEHFPTWADQAHVAILDEVLNPTSNDEDRVNYATTVFSIWFAIRAKRITAEQGERFLELDATAIRVYLDEMIRAGLEAYATIDGKGWKAEVHKPDDAVLFGSLLHLLVERKTWSSLKADRAWRACGGDPRMWHQLRSTMIDQAVRYVQTKKPEVAQG